MDINVLLRRIDKGDRSAFAELVEHFQRPLFGYLGRMGLRQGQAEEVAQETFLRAWQRLNDYDQASSAFSTWLFTIARNLAINELTRASSHHEMTLGDAVIDAECDQQQPAQMVMERQLRQQVQHALRLLPYDDRSALALGSPKELTWRRAA